MAYVTYSLNEHQMQEIEDALAKTPQDVERVINETIHVKGAKLIMQNIIGFMPIGDRDRVNGRRKKHAKTSDSLAQKDFNLGVHVFNKPAFEYLLYPNLGIGKRNPVANDFFDEGLEASGDTVFQWIIEAIDKHLGGLK